jgi:hypothetical protein
LLASPRFRSSQEVRAGGTRIGRVRAEGGAGTNDRATHQRPLSARTGPPLRTSRAKRGDPSIPLELGPSGPGLRLPLTRPFTSSATGMASANLFPTKEPVSGLGLRPAPAPRCDRPVIQSPETPVQHAGNRTVGPIPVLPGDPDPKGTGTGPCVRTATCSTDGRFGTLLPTRDWTTWAGHTPTAALPRPAGATHLTWRPAQHIQGAGHTAGVRRRSRCGFCPGTELQTPAKSSVGLLLTRPAALRQHRGLAGAGTAWHDM